MTDRQQTGIWFIITGLLILSLWVFSYAIVASALNSNFITLNENKFSQDQLYVIGGSAVVSVQLVSLVGVPLVLTGLAQVLMETQKVKTGKKK